MVYQNLVKIVWTFMVWQNLYFKFCFRFSGCPTFEPFLCGTLPAASAAKQHDNRLHLFGRSKVPRRLRRRSSSARNFRIWKVLKIQFYKVLTSHCVQKFGLVRLSYLVSERQSKFNSYNLLFHWMYLSEHLCWFSLVRLLFC